MNNGSLTDRYVDIICHTLNHHHQHHRHHHHQHSLKHHNDCDNIIIMKTFISITSFLNDFVISNIGPTGKHDRATIVCTAISPSRMSPTRPMQMIIVMIVMMLDDNSDDGG